MRRLAALALLLLLAGCVPRVIWTGGDQSRRVNEEIRGNVLGQWFGKTGRRYDVIASQSVSYSLDGHHVAFAARRNWQWWLVHDGVEEGPWLGVAEPTFSPDGTHFAYLAESRDGWRVMAAGRKGVPEEAVREGSLRVGNDGHTAYIAVKPGCATLVIDQRREPCHARLSDVVLWNQLTYVIARDRDGDRILDNGPTATGFATSASEPVPEIGAWTISEAGELAYAVRQGDLWIPIVNGRRLNPQLAVRELRFGSRGLLCAFVGVGEQGARVYVDGIAWQPWPVIEHLALARTGRRIVYIARNEAGAWLVDELRRIGPFADVGDVQISDDGQHVAAVAQRSDGAVVWHDGIETRFDLVLPQTLTLSDDGLHFAVITGDDRPRRLWISVDGKRELPASSDDIFGDPRPLRPWVAARLAEVLGARDAPAPRVR